MKEKTKYKESKEEKERKVLYTAIKSKISVMRERLRLQLTSPDIREIDEDAICCVNKGLRDLQDIFFDLVFDNVPPGEILKNSAEHLGNRFFATYSGDKG